VKLGRVFQEGKRTRVTTKMQRLYAAAGLPIPQKGEIKQPARPIFRPIYVRRRREIVDRIEKRISMYLRERALSKATGMKIQRRKIA
jgi:hypothetical protein